MRTPDGVAVPPVAGLGLAVGGQAVVDPGVAGVFTPPGTAGLVLVQGVVVDGGAPGVLRGLLGLTGLV